MTRLILAILLAFSLASTPGPAFAAPSAGCSMQGADAGMAVDHEKMGCCTPECAIGCPSGLLPVDGLDVPDAEIAASPALASVTEALDSVNPAATDPPPRPRSA